jgi:hypothetical protein
MVEPPTPLVPVRGQARAYVLGGNAGTLAFVSSLRPENKQITTWLVPLAWTPAGVALGENWQRVAIAADNIVGWVDQTFPAEDERAFVSPARDLEMLQRVGWQADVPERLAETTLLNPEDLPDDVLDGLSQPPVALTQCAVCRRTCVRDQFEWNERQLCAWDYHAIVFGKRGPWRSEPYEERLFATIPRAAYVVSFLIAEAGVDPIMSVGGLPEDTLQTLINAAISAGAGAAFMAVRTDEGLSLLRERSKPEA